MSFRQTRSPRFNNPLAVTPPTPSPATSQVKKASSVAQAAISKVAGVANAAMKKLAGVTNT